MRSSESRTTVLLGRLGDPIRTVEEAFERVTMNPIKSESSWVFVAEEKALQDNSMSLVFPKGLSVLLIKKSGQFYALSNKCAHMACGLGGGILNGYTIQCPCHDWGYDIRTGEFLNAKEIRIPTYQFKLEDGRILINIDEGGWP